jgi:hypothetical protein
MITDVFNRMVAYVLFAVTVFPVSLTKTTRPMSKIAARATTNVSISDLPRATSIRERASASTDASESTSKSIRSLAKRCARLASSRVDSNVYVKYPPKKFYTPLRPHGYKEAIR